MRILSIIVSALIVILVVTFTVLNSTFIIDLPAVPPTPFTVSEIPVNLIFFEEPIKVNFAVAIVISFGLGALLGVLVASFIILRLKRANIRLEKKALKSAPGIDAKNSLPPVNREVS